MLIAGLFCGSLSVLLYLNTLGGELVFDDRAAIIENHDLLPSSPWTNLLWHDFWGDPLTHHKSHKSFRPLSSATFKINYHLHQLNVTGYHVVNVIVNAAVCCLYVQLCARVFDGKIWSSMVAGLLFTTHPIHTEAVASVVGRTEILCSLFFLVTILTYQKAIHSQNGASWKWVLSSMFFCLCSFLSKEQGITAMAVCIAYEMLIVLKMDLHSSIHLFKNLATSPERLSKPQRRFLSRAVSLIVFALAVAFIRMRLMQGAPKFSRSDNPGQTLPSPYRQLYYLHLVFVNLWLLLNPSHLVHDWRFGFVPLFDSLFHAHHLLTLLTFISYIIFIYWSFIRRRSGRSNTPAMFGMALMTITFLPASNLFFRVGFVVAERVLSLPSMGFCILIAFGVTKLITYIKRPIIQKAVKVTIFLLLLSNSLKTVNRNTRWLSGKSLYVEALKLNKYDGLMYSNLGYSLEGTDMLLAEDAHRLAVQLSPNFSQPFRNYGALLMRQRRYNEAELMFRRAIEILGVRERARSKSIETYQSLAYVISMNESRLTEALSILKVALSMKPGVPDLLNMKGYLLHNLNRSSEAVTTLEQVLRINPSHTDSLYHLGIAYSKLGEIDKAEELLRKVLKLDATNGRAMLHLGQLLAKRDPPTVQILLEAGKYLKSVIAADPSLTDAQYALGLVYRKLEKSTHAEKHFMKALELEPHHNEALVELGYMHYTQKNFTQVIGLLKKLPKTELFSSMEFVQAGSLLVNSHIQLGHWREAEELFEMMLSRGSQKLQIDALNGLGELKLRRGEYQMARHYFSRTLEIDSDNQLAANRINKLLRSP